MQATYTTCRRGPLIFSVHWARTNMDPRIGIDPISRALQAGANPSQLPRG